MTERYARLKIFPFADFSKLKEKKVTIVGVGGLGATCAEIMTRCGIGRLTIFDFDKLEEANLNRLIYRTHQVGMFKVDALREYLLAANSDVELLTYPNDVTDGKGYDALLKEARESDLVLGCVDSFHVRMFLNSLCVRLKVPLIDGGASLDGINGSVHSIIPGKTPCYRCNKPALKDDSTVDLKKSGDGACHFTSLPTTMGIIASLQCQEALKYLLSFGKVAPYILYYGLEGKMQRYNWKRDPKCPVCGGVK